MKRGLLTLSAAFLLCLGLGSGQARSDIKYCGYWLESHFWTHTTSDEVVHCLGLGIYIDAREHNGRTALHLAARNSPDADVIRALLAAGADVHARDEDGRSPLHLAAKYSISPSVIVALLDGGADINAASDDGETPLHRAAESSVPPAIEALLAAGADPAAVDGDGNTPFEVAEDNPYLLGSGALQRLDEAYQEYLRAQYEATVVDGRIVLQSNFEPDPYVVSGIVIAPISRQTRCPVGHIAKDPAFTLEYLATHDHSLTFAAASTDEAADLTLYVEHDGPSGLLYYCGDDENGSNPAITITNPHSGYYRVWPGIYSAASDLSVPAQVAISKYSTSERYASGFD